MKFKLQTSHQPAGKVGVFRPDVASALNTPTLMSEGVAHRIL